MEFALVLPLLLLIVLGMVDFGQAINYWNDETHLANEAARYAAVNNSPSKDGSGAPIPGSLNAAIKGQAVRSTAIVTFCFPDNSPYTPGPGGGASPAVSAGSPVKAIVRDTYHWFKFGRFLGNNLNLADTVLTGTSTMRLEQDFKNNGNDAYTVSATC